MNKLKYQCVYNYITNHEFKININLKVIKEPHYKTYLITECEKLEKIIDAIINNDIQLFNSLINNFSGNYNKYKNYQIHNRKSFNLLREKILNKKSK